MYRYVVAFFALFWIVKSSDVPTMLPSSIPKKCTQCDDNPSKPMIRGNEACTDDNVMRKLLKHCNSKRKWVRNFYCAQSCFNIGIPYDGKFCCPVNTEPSSLPSTSPLAERLRNVFITEIADPDSLPRGRYIELYFSPSYGTNIIDDLFIVKWKNGRLNVRYQEIKLPNNSLIPEDRFVIICPLRRNFEQYYNTACDIKADQNVFSNGNDVIAIVNRFTTPNLDSEIIDTF